MRGKVNFRGKDNWNWFTKRYRLKFTKGYKLDSIREILSLPLFLPLESRLPSSVRVRGRVRVRVE